MISLIWFILKITAVMIWVGSTVHVFCSLALDSKNTEPKPYPFRNLIGEPRFLKILNSFIYAPSIIFLWAWRGFKKTPTGESVIKWFKQKT